MSHQSGNRSGFGLTEYYDPDKIVVVNLEALSWMLRVAQDNQIELADGQFARMIQDDDVARMRIINLGGDDILVGSNMVREL